MDGRGRHRIRCLPAAATRGTRRHLDAVTGKRDFLLRTWNCLRCLHKQPQVAADKPVEVSCGAGRGWTGTVLACYLVAKGLGVQEAMAKVREARRGSIEIAQQEAAERELAHRHPVQD